MVGTEHPKGVCVLLPGPGGLLSRTKGNYGHTWNWRGSQLTPRWGSLGGSFSEGGSGSGRDAQRPHLLSPLEGARGQEPGMRRLQNLEEVKERMAPEPPEGRRPGWHLALSPVGPSSHL